MSFVQKFTKYEAPMVPYRVVLGVLFEKLGGKVEIFAGVAFFTFL